MVAQITTLDEDQLKKKASDLRQKAEAAYTQGDCEKAIALLKKAAQHWPCDGIAQRLNVLLRRQAKLKGKERRN